MSRVIAIYGPPAVGKSTVADILGTRTSSPIRHCGDVVKARAKELGAPLDGLADEEHRIIDAATRDAALQAINALIIEGRFLDQVLRGTPGVTLVALTCGFEERVRRHSSRGGSRESLQQQDLWTEQFRTRMYGSKSQRHSNVIVVDTEGFDAAAVAENVLSETSSE